MSVDSQEKVRCVGSQSHGNVRDLTIGGLEEVEFKGVEATLLGQRWMSVEDGRAVFRSRTEELPSPTEDDDMLPFWRRPNEEEREGARQDDLFDEDRLTNSMLCGGPAFVIQSLCGYYYSPEAYRREAERLESWGFQCLRSRRGSDGRFTEAWLLWGLWAAEGGLKEAVQGIDDKETAFKTAVSFMCRHASFGTLDSTCQRAAMVVD